MANFAKLENDQVNKMSINSKITFSPDNGNAKKMVQVSFWQRRPKSSKASLVFISKKM